MKLFKAAAVEKAMISLARALEDEARAQGEEVKTLSLAAFTVEDPNTVNRAVYGCSCEGCLNRIIESIEGINGSSTPEGILNVHAEH